MGITTTRAGMKIDNQVMPLANKQASVKPEINALFEDWLDAPTANSNSDDYYWQHQNQLQQSALTFASTNKSERTARSVEVATLPDQESGMIAKNNVFARQPLLASALNSDNAPPEPLLNSVSPMKPIIAVFKKAIESTAMPIDNKILSKPDAKNSGKETITKQTMPTNLIFKNHQLFINNNLAELTLNTSQLSKQETQELQKLMKQWLMHKRYALTKLIINGVLQ